MKPVLSTFTRAIISSSSSSSYSPLYASATTVAAMISQAHSSGSSARTYSSSSRTMMSSSGSSSSNTTAAPKQPMRIVRFQAEDGEEHFGSFTDVTETKCTIAARNPTTGKMGLTSEVKPVDIILPPVDPPAIYCIGLNYADHAAEVKMTPTKYPTVFMKPVTSLTGHNNAIVIPHVAHDPPEVDYEAELAVVIGPYAAKNVSEAEAMDHVLDIL
jgi:2-keto-4-pentenoate hydratase/2-oxohepta-3-ene-1,7-dioic acid hydratase in catechol pathway